MILSFGYLVLRVVLQLIVLGRRGERAKEIEVLVFVTRSRCCVARSSAWIWSYPTVR